MKKISLARQPQYALLAALYESSKHGGDETKVCIFESEVQNRTETAVVCYGIKREELRTDK
jgi:hypothetical protein